MRCFREVGGRHLLIRAIVLGVAIGLMCGAQVAALAADGANHWSFQKPMRPDVPDESALEHGERVVNPIDAFI